LIYDLHTHTTASDGTLTPEALVSRAKSQGVDVLAITDHDTTSGLQAAIEVADKSDLSLVSGIEFSCEWSGRVIHVVGLCISPNSPVIRENILAQAALRDQRAEAIAVKLAKQGIPDALVGASVYADGGVIGRPHFAKYLIEKGYVKDFNAAFKRYLGDGKSAFVKQEWPHITKVVEWINEAGGIAVLAHPDKYKMTRTKLKALLTDFVAVGGVAMEVVSGKQTPNVTQKLARLAQELGLYASCGSDFHSPGQAWQELGGFSEMPVNIPTVWQHSRFKPLVPTEKE